MQSRVALCSLGLAWLCACGKRGEAGKPVPSATAHATPNRSSALGSNTAPRPAQAKPGCRALAVTGQATANGVPISTGSLLDGEQWVELGPGASVSLRHTLTSRELKLIGPGLILPCRHGREEILIADGQLSTSTNLGVRPGAEVLIATPLSTIHYGDAAIDVQLGPRGLGLRVKEGEAWLVPREPSAASFKNPLRRPAEAALPPSKSSAAELANACQTAAEAAAASARRVLGVASQAPQASLGERAAAQMRDRSAARAACSMAAAATGRMADPAERQQLWASIAHSDEVWQSVPLGVSAQKN